jgi:Mn2+/Fe2+ NRAMP family transporter
MSSQYKPSIFQKFFWLISGSEIHVLKDCKHDYNRHATMGFILFMTWLFATFAGGFAGWYFGHSLKTAFGFGLMWGLMIYAIDRGMVISLKKNPTIEKQPFWIPFLTRAVLGIVIAFFISIPFEILIFNEDIKIQMEKEKYS